MPYLNSVTVMGHLAADPELRFTPTGQPVANFTVAVNHRSGGQGEEGGQGKGKKPAKQKVSFFRCEVFGGWAENLCKTAKKGALVLVRGRLVQERWIDAETRENRSRVKVQGQQAMHLAAHYAEEPEPEVEAGAEVGDSDAPF